LQPGQKLVIDNATFHKGGRIEELVKAVGCEVQGATTELKCLLYKLHSR